MIKQMVAVKHANVNGAQFKPGRVFWVTNIKGTGSMVRLQSSRRANSALATTGMRCVESFAVECE